MPKRIILSEAQFKDYMRIKLNEEKGGADNENRKLTVDEVKNLIKGMVDNDFYVEFPQYGRKYHCTNLNEKGEILEAICTSYPERLSNGNIGAISKVYGAIEIENIINIG